MANKEQLIQVAKRCSQYNFIGGKQFTSAITDNVPSCENCEHFTKDHKCDINLTDEILSNMDEKLDC